MISVRGGSRVRNGRKGMEVGFRNGDMEENELEEGEASFDSTIDPDIALSYLDEKLQHVLGHFQKDFEGGVSAENLGAKFGGYGSFLPAYPQSPSWSHPRTPPEVVNQNRPRSPNNMHPEGARRSSLSASSNFLSAGPKVTSSAGPELKTPSGNDQVNQGVSMLSNNVDELSTKVEPDKATNFPDQKALKFRIKVGVDNLSTCKNAEIYSGLGLDVSPSSSLDNSPTDSEVMYHDLQDIPDESPTSILQIMTSIRSFGGLLLSPLSDDMTQLTENGGLRGDGQAKSSYKFNLSSALSVSGIDLTTSGERKPKLLEESAASVEPSNDTNKDNQNGSGIVLKRDDIDTSACEELVSNALKLPPSSNSFSDVADSAKDMSKSVATSRNAIKSSVKNGSLSNVVEEELLESGAQNGRVEKLNKKVRKPESVDENLAHQVKCEFSIKNESDVSEERKSAKSDDISKQKIGQKVSSYYEDGSKLKVDQKVPSHNGDGSKSAPGELQSFSGGKKKSKGSQSQCALGTDSQENSSLFNSSMVAKSKKVTNSDGLKKGHGKATDKYKDFFGDLNIEQYDEEIASEEMTSGQRVKDSELVEKRGISGRNIADERLNDTGSHLKLPSCRPPHNGKWPNHDATIPMVAPLVKEDWVCCDKCQAWRLLPLGTNPESLPEKWLCSMLDWLPGMNRCSISEEATTNALRALYQTQASVVPLPAVSGSQLDQHANSGVTLLAASSVDARRSNEDCHDSGLQPIASGGKRKSGTKDVMTTTSQDNPVQSSNLKDGLQTCAKSKNFSEADHSSIEELGSQYVDQPSRSSVDKYGTEKEKRLLLDINSEEGGETKLKMKDQRDNDSDFPRASKKIKTDDQQKRDENRTSDTGGASSKAGRSSNGWSGKDSRKSSSSSKDSKGNTKKRSVSSNKFEAEVQTSISWDDGPLQMGKSVNDGSMKKKGSDHQNGDVDSVPLQSSQHHSQGSRSYSEDTRENELRKDKKPRVSKSEGKDSSGNKDGSVSGKKGRGMTDQKMRQDLDCTPSRRSMDASVSLGRDLGPGQPSLAATSSSSKVSGSRKSKTSLQEMKDSPVESVSSSPFRISGADKLTQVRRSIAAKEDQDAGFLASGSPRRSLEREDTGVGDQSVKMRDSSFNVTHHGSLESNVLDSQGRDLDHGSIISKVECASLTDFVSQGGPNSKINALGQGRQNSSQTGTSVQIQTVGKRNDHQSPSNGLHIKKSGKGSTSKSSEKISGSISGFENGNETARNKFQEKSGSSSDRTEKHFVSKKESDGKLGENQPQISGRDGTIIEPDVSTRHDMKQNVSQDSDIVRSSRKSVSDRTGIEVPGRGKSHSLPPTVRGQTDTMTRLQPIAESQKEYGECKEHDAISKASKQSKKGEKQNGNQHINLRHPTPPLHKSRDIEAPSPIRKDPSSQAVTNAVKEAKDLKHLADRLKNSGSPDSTGYYFQAALKFLHGASLLESGNSENTKHNEMIQSVQMYSSTAKLCEFCAHEYERSKDMAAAALAYKCMEVAYMRVVYTSHNGASRDRNELLAALQITPTGESPSSSASDIDNLNNPAMVDKGVQAKSVGSPQIAGNHALTARNRSSFMRLINYAQDVNNAMEATRKSRNAFAAANPRLDGAQHKEGFSSVKKALDFNFQDVDGLLRLVRVAMEAICR